MSRRLASFRHTAAACGVHPATVRNYVKRGELVAYRLPGKKGHFVDLDEAKALIGKRQQHSTFGPDAVVRDLSNVVGGDFEVLG